MLPLRARSGCESALAGAYDELEVFRLAGESGGMRAARLLEPTDPGEPMLVIAEWDDAASYERWLASPVRERLGRELTPLLVDEPVAGRLYHDAGSAWAAGSPTAPEASA